MKIDIQTTTGYSSRETFVNKDKNDNFDELAFSVWSIDFVCCG